MLFTDAGLQLEHQQLRSLNPAQDGALIYRADVQSTLHEVVLYGFLQPNAAGYMHVSPCEPSHGLSPQGCPLQPLANRSPRHTACNHVRLSGVSRGHLLLALALIL